MSQVFDPANEVPAAAPAVAVSAPVPSRMVRLSTAVRALAVDLLEAEDTRIIKIAADQTGWSVEVEVFSPNPELTVSLRGAVKSILERARYRFQLDADLQLVSLEPIEG